MGGSVVRQFQRSRDNQPALGFLPVRNGIVLARSNPLAAMIRWSRICATRSAPCVGRRARDAASNEQFAHSSKQIDPERVHIHGETNL